MDETLSRFLLLKRHLSTAYSSRGEHIDYIDILEKAVGTLDPKLDKSFATVVPGRLHQLLQETENRTLWKGVFQSFKNSAGYKPTQFILKEVNTTLATFLIPIYEHDLTILSKLGENDTRLGFNGVYLDELSCTYILDGLKDNALLKSVDLSCTLFTDELTAKTISVLAAKENPQSLEGLALSGNALLLDQLTYSNPRPGIQNVMFPGLTSLDLSHNNISGAGVELLRNIFLVPGNVIHSLDISYNNIGDTGVETICQVLQDNKNNIGILNISFTGMADLGWDALSVYLTGDNSQLFDLNVGGNTITSSHLEQFLRSLSFSHTSLNGLDLSSTKESPLNLKSISPSIDVPDRLVLPELLESDISSLGNLLCSGVGKFIAASMNNSTMRTVFVSLDLASCGISHMSLEILIHEIKAAMLSSKHEREFIIQLASKKLDIGLRKLNLSGNVLSTNLASLESLLGYTSGLEEIDLSGIGMSYSNLFSLGRCLAKSYIRLRKLNISNNSLHTAVRPNDTLDTLFHMFGSSISGLEEILLESMGTTRILDTLPALFINAPRLSILDVSSNGLESNSDITTLLRVLREVPDRKLVALNLSGNNFGDTGMMDVCEIFNLHDFTRLTLNISDCGFGELGSFILAESLTNVDFPVEVSAEYNNITTTDAWKFLRAMKENEFILSLCLDDNPINPSLIVHLDNESRGNVSKFKDRKQ